MRQQTFQADGEARLRRRINPEPREPAVAASTGVGLMKVFGSKLSGKKSRKRELVRQDQFWNALLRYVHRGANRVKLWVFLKRSRLRQVYRFE